MFFEKYSGLSEKEVEKILEKTFNLMYKASQMLNDINEPNSCFAAHQALLPATILAYRILCENAKTERNLKTIAMQTFKDKDLKDTLESICKDNPNTTSNTYYNGQRIWGTYQLLLSVDEQFAECLNRKEC